MMGVGLVHGKYTHLLQWCIIKLAADAGYIDLKGIKIEDVLHQSVEVKSEDGKSSLFGFVMDLSSSSILKKPDVDDINFGIVNHVGAEIMLASDKEELPYLSGYFRNLFFNNIDKIIKIYQKKYDVDISPQQILIAQVCAESNFAALTPIIEAGEYYKMRDEEKSLEGLVPSAYKISGKIVKKVMPVENLPNYV
jgi:hypothetical protein